MSPRAKVRYAVVGLGHFAQAAILPAFKNAAEKAELAAIVTGDPEKASKLGEKYNCSAHSYEDFDKLASAGKIDAVYIALPNSMHREYTERAAAAGIHVLCEKPLAYTVEDARAMVETCRAAGVLLMTAYRLHFEEGNLAAIEAVKAGRIGEARTFHATHTMQVDEDNTRVSKSLGGGPLEDIGVYCINAARYLFRNEPIEVMAFAVHGNDPRFDEVPESVAALMRFPGHRLATFQCSFNETKVSEYRVIGTEGMIVMDPGFTWNGDIEQRIVIKDKEQRKTFKHRDQVAAEILYFANCVLTGEQPEPSGTEGLIDVRIIDALRTSYAKNRPVKIQAESDAKRPDKSQSIRKKPHAEPPLVNAAPPSRA
jgi:predicted dehydrogenase